MSEPNNPPSQMVAIALTIQGKVIASIHTAHTGKDVFGLVNVSLLFTDGSQLAISGAGLSLMYCGAQAKEEANREMAPSIVA